MIRFCALAAAGAAPLVLFAAQEQTPSASNVVEAWRGDLRATIDLEGALVPADATPVSLWLDGYRGELLVLEAIPHGSFVNESDVLVRIDTKSIDEQIRQAEFDVSQAEQKLQRTERQMAIDEAAGGAALARAEKEAQWAQRQLESYREKERGFKEEQTRLSRQGTEHRLDDQRDELEQLEKMYEEDELVDATEEIVLKRARRQLALSTAYAQLSHQQQEHDLAHNEAMKLESLELDAAQKTDAAERQKRARTIQQEASGADLERTRFDLESQRDTLARLHHDREMLIVRAPRAGLVLHGEPEAAPGSSSVDRGSRLSLFQTIMTVGDPDKLKIVTSVPESSLLEAKSGSAAEISTKAVDGFEAVGSLDVEHLASSRDSKGENLYRGEISIDQRDPRLRPGMQCSVKIIKQARDVVLVPASAVIEEDDSMYVRAAKSADGSFERRKVVLGASDGTNTIIKDGLDAGEYVMSEPEGSS